MRVAVFNRSTEDAFQAIPWTETSLSSCFRDKRTVFFQFTVSYYIVAMSFWMRCHAETQKWHRTLFLNGKLTNDLLVSNGLTLNGWFGCACYFFFHLYFNILVRLFSLYIRFYCYLWRFVWAFKAQIKCIWYVIFSWLRRTMDNPWNSICLFVCFVCISIFMYARLLGI